MSILWPFYLAENPPLEAITVIYELTQVNGQLHLRCSVRQMGREYSKTSGNHPRCSFDVPVWAKVDDPHSALDGWWQCPLVILFLQYFGCLFLSMSVCSMGLKERRSLLKDGQRPEASDQFPSISNPLLGTFSCNGLLVVSGWRTDFLKHLHSILKPETWKYSQREKQCAFT